MEQLSTVEGVAVPEPVCPEHLDRLERHMLLEIGCIELKLTLACPCDRIGSLVLSTELDKLAYRVLDPRL